MKLLRGERGHSLTAPVIQLRLGDSIEMLRHLDPGTFGVVIADPPYGIEFMGKEWDRLGITKASPVPKPGNLGGFATGDKPSFERVKKHLPEMQAWHERWLQEVFRILPSGGLVKAFSGTRTFHRLAAAMEAVGFELVPGESLNAWVYGSGFPKSLNISKAIDKHFGKFDDRPVVGQSSQGSGPNRVKMMNHGRGDTGLGSWDGSGQTFNLTKAATPEAAKFEGYGTALKPAWEPILIGRKP